MTRYGARDVTRGPMSRAQIATSRGASFIGEDWLRSWTLVKDSNKIRMDQMQIFMDTADAFTCFSRSGSEVPDVSSLKTSPEKPERPNRAAHRAANQLMPSPCQVPINQFGSIFKGPCQT